MRMAYSPNPQLNTALETALETAETTLLMARGADRGLTQTVVKAIAETVRTAAAGADLSALLIARYGEDLKLGLPDISESVLRCAVNYAAAVQAVAQLTPGGN